MAVRAEPGQVHVLEVRQLEVIGPHALEAVERALGEDLHESLRGFTPRVPKDEASVVKVGKGKFTSQGPRGLPRIEFAASAGAAFIDIDVSVRGDLEVRAASCRAGEQGKRLFLNLQDSAEAVIDNARSFEVTLCWSQGSDGKTRVRAGSSFVEGDDFGVIAGPKTVKMLKAQTEPMVSAFASQINRILAALTAAELQKNSVQGLTPPCASCGVP